MKNRQALLVGDHGLHFLPALETASLLKRSGFGVDLVTSNPSSRHLTSVSGFTFVSKPEDLPRAASDTLAKGDHDLVVVLEDFTLKDIHESDLSDDEKLALLPVVGKGDFQHLCSKIGLARLLDKHGIPAPEFAVAHDRAELRSSAERIGYPVVVKIDFSGAGEGTYECSGPEHLEAIGEDIGRWPVLVQKYIEGTLMDLSGFFQNSQLVCFSYSTIVDSVLSKFSPSSVRIFKQLGAVEKAVFDELRALGRAVGAHGFVNISCIQPGDDHRRYFFEADMRPNAWVNAPRRCGDDPAARIAAYFADGEGMTYPQPLNSGFASEVVVPCYTRIGLWELAVNRYGAWACFPEESAFVVVFALAELKMKDFARRFVKPLVPTGLWSRLKRSYDAAFRKVMG